MSSKITRRAAIGSFFAAAVAIPFVVRSLMKPKPLEIGENTYLAKFREQYQAALDFPRTFDPYSADNIIPGREREGFLEKIRWFKELPEKQRESALRIQKRFWTNYSKIDEAEFDFTYFGYDKDGKKESDNFFMSGHAWMKFGYGMEIKGHNVAGEPIHWVFNMDGDATLPAAEEMNLSSMFRTFFDLNEALPEYVVFFGDVTNDVELPVNPYIVGEGLYDEVEMPKRGEGGKIRNLPVEVDHLFSHKTYYSQKTGLPELRVKEFIPDTDYHRYRKGEITLQELPKPDFRYTTIRYEKFSGIFIPVENILRRSERLYGGKPALQSTCFNIKLKLLQG